MPEIKIREMTAADLPRILDLADQLGYPAALQDLTARFHRISALKDHTLVTACAGAEGVIGWLHLCVLTPLEAPAAAQISGIVVDKLWRGKGVGRLLVEYAERWAAERGLDRLTLRSRDDREGAHAFYRGRGFVAAKRSVLFEKVLDRGRA